MERVLVKGYEVMGRVGPQQAAPVPTAVKQQARVGQLVNQMAADDQKQHKPTGEEVYLVLLYDWAVDLRLCKTAEPLNALILYEKKLFD